MTFQLVSKLKKLLVILFISLFFIVFRTPIYATGPINGTFIYLGGRNTDNQPQPSTIPDLIGEIASLKMDTIIVSPIQHKERDSGCSGNSFKWGVDAQAKLETIFVEAAKNNISVYVGPVSSTAACAPSPVFATDADNRQTVINYLRDYDNPDNPISYILAHYGNNPQFKGWYIHDEPDLTYWPDPSVAYAYYKGYVDAIRAKSDKPIVVSPGLGLADNLTPQILAARAAAFKQNTGITIYAWQDSEGSVGISLGSTAVGQTYTVRDFFAAISNAVGKGSFWSVSELGNCCTYYGINNSRGAYSPTSIARLNQQLYLASADYVAKRLVWINQHQMRPKGLFNVPIQQGGNRLFAAYKALYQIDNEYFYIHPASYHWTTPPSPQYPDDNNREMFDMQVGANKPYSEMFRDPRYTGIPHAAEMVVDLGSSQKVQWIGAHVIHHNASGIYYPSIFTVSCSLDNTNWAQKAQWGLPIEKTDGEYVFGNPNGQPLNADCRYLKLRLELPTNALIFIDEIELVGSPVKPGDFNNDGKVDTFDYNILVANFGNPYTIFDYNILVENFGI